MNSVDKTYHDLLELVLREGKKKSNRTGVNTIGVFGAQAKFDLSQGFPVLTTKKIHLKSVVHELLWFLSGSTNIKYLVDNDVHIWDEWAYKRYCDAIGNDWPLRPVSIETFLEIIKEKNHPNFRFDAPICPTC